MQEQNDIVDAEIVEEGKVEEVAAPQAQRLTKNTLKTMLAALSQAVNSGEMKSGQAAEIRRRFGISKRYFTKRKFNFAKTKRRRQIAALSRKANRGTGKGEKRTGGIT